MTPCRRLAAELVGTALLVKGRPKSIANTKGVGRGRGRGGAVGCGGVPGLRIGTTKSASTTRDLDLLREISRVSELHVNFSLISLDADLGRFIEPRAPRPDLRLRAMWILADPDVRTAHLGEAGDG